MATSLCSVCGQRKKVVKGKIEQHKFAGMVCSGSNQPPAS